MAIVMLGRVAFGRSGDKGEASNVGLVARSPEVYEWMRRRLTPEWAKAVLADVVRGEVERFELPNLLALNFILRDSLGGGGSSSLLVDAQGKTHAQAFLRALLDVPDDLLDRLPP